MGFVNYKGYFGFGRQSAQGAGVAPSFFVKFLTGGIKPENVIKDFREGGFYRQGKFAEKVGANVSAELEAYLRADLGGWLATMALGSDVVSGLGPYTHTITPSDLQWWSIETSDINDTLVQRMVDSKIDTLEISGSAEDFVSLKAGFIGLSIDASVSKATESYSTEGILKFLHGSFTTFGGVNNEISEFTVSISNNLEAYRGAELTNRQLIEKGLDVSIDFKFKTTQDDEYRKVYFGDAAGTSLSEAVEESSIVLTFDNGLSGTDQRQFKITIHQATYSAMELPGLNAEGDVITYGATAIATNDGTNPLITIEVINNDSAAYDGS